MVVMKSAESAVVVSEFSPEQRQIVLGTLRRVLESSHFSKSKRYPAFLEYIVRSALEEQTDSLKERTIGVEVFGRTPDYDTSTDPVVRIAAGEVRRRMAVFFSEHPESPVWIDIHAGSYRAEFHFRANSGVGGAAGGEAAGSAGELRVASTVNGLKPTEADAAKSEQGAAEAVVTPSERRLSWRSTTARVAIAAMILAMVAGATWWRLREQTRGRREFWWPLAGNQPSVLVLVGKTAIPESAGIKHANLSMGDVIVTGQICSILRSYKSDCNVRPGELEGAGDLLGKPMVVIGGFNNPWSSRILAPLPFQFQFRPAAQPGQRAPRVIVEHQPSGDTILGEIDHFDDAPLPRDSDYAIVARFHSDITESTAVVIAGLGPPGTGSAEQYISNQEKMKELISRAPKDWQGQNFEAVLKVDLIQGNAGHVDVVAARFW